jgi:glycosyltransferase involved in cell wall biosynthesis
MRVAMLCNFPLYTLENSPTRFLKGQHATSWLVDLPEAFSKIQGLEMHWITLSDQAEKEMAFPVDGAFFHVLPTSKKGRAASFFVQDRRRIKECLNKVRPDVVHGWGTEDVYALAAVTSGYPHLISMQGILSALILKSWMHPREYFQALLEIWCLRKAQLVTTESKWGAAIVRKRRGSQPIEIVEYGVRNSFFSSKWNPEKEKPYAIFVGSIVARKGIEDLVEAFRNLKKEGYRLKVIGRAKTKYLSIIQKRAEGTVDWLGEQPAEVVQSEMSRAWCLALPTRADTSPNVVKEARVIGLPVITTRHGGQASYVRDGEDGYFVECGDVNGLIGKLEMVLGSFSKAKEMGDLGKKKFRELFMAKRTGDGFMKMYRTNGQ